MVTMSGSGFSAGCDLRCDFYELLNTNATFDISTGTLRCVAPAGAHMAHTVVEISLNGQQYSRVQADFSNSPLGLQLGGSAMVDGGVLKLTVLNASGSLRSISGWAVFELPPPCPALWSWRVSFELFVGGGYGGDGFSFMYGDFSGVVGESVGLTAHDEAVTTSYDGLLVKLYTRGKFIHIIYNDTLLHQFDVHDAIRTQSWVRVELVVDAHGLSFFHDGWSGWAYNESSRGMGIPGWNPQRGWRFAFAASNSRSSDHHWIDNLVIESPWLEAGPALYEMEVTVNGQHFLPAANITYTAHAAVSSINPRTGPVAGNTQLRVEGVNLLNGDNYTCRFDDIVLTAELLPGGALECVTPSMLQTSRARRNLRSAFSISLNNQDYTEDPIVFTYRELPIVSSIMPDAGPSVGGTLVRVRGSHFAGGDGYRCKFGDGAPVMAVLQGARSLGYYLECMSPVLYGAESGEVSVLLEITVNNQQYTQNKVLFRYFTQQHIDGILPTSGPVLGDTAVLVRFEGPAGGQTRVMLTGSNFTFGSHILCKFGEDVVNGTLEGPTALAPAGVVCVSPPKTPATAVALELTLNGKDYTNDGHQFIYYVADAPASYLPSFDAVRCVSPNMSTVAGEARLTVSINGQQFTAEPLNFTLHNVSVTALSPAASLFHGGQLINVSASGLVPSVHAHCRFETLSTGSLAMSFNSSVG
eukprot:jgi/Chrpa1/23403/Chrysochromulina_OHIO_Genome00017736-RA